MKTSVLTIRIDDDEERLLVELSRALGKSRSDVVREAIRRQIALLMFEETRKNVMPFAEAQRYLSDEDVFRDVS
jgi:predicted transcriptional regulator